MKKLLNSTHINTQKKSVKFIASLLLVVLLVLTLVIGFNFIDSKFNGNSDINLSLITDNKDLIKKNDDILDMIEYHKYDEYLVREEELREDKLKEDENKTEDIVAQYEDKLSNLEILQAKDEENLTDLAKEELIQFIDVNISTIDGNISTIELVKEDLSSKPKLVIIMDDISFGHQIKDVQALNLDITLSFLPPNSIHPRTSILAKDIDEYMVHLPLEALKYPNEEDHTLNVIDSNAVIEARIKKIREWFPKARYVNNHTGSKFTADIEALKKLFKVLETYNFKFIDSRTTPNTKVKLVTEDFSLNYIRRDVFLDNNADVEYIKDQLKKAIQKAKKNGVAIAICHPRKTTIEALSLSKEILNEVHLVNINKLNP